VTLDETLRAAVEEGVFPGCVALVLQNGAQRYLGAHGRLASHPRAAEWATPVTAETVYDLASLTKVLSTTTLIARAVGQGRLRLDDRLPESLAVGDFRPSLQDLLEHAAGLEAHREFFHGQWSLGPGQREALMQAVRKVRPACPPRTRAIYTDLGFLLLGAWLEDLEGARLDVLFRELIAEPLGVADQIGFCPLDRPPPFERARVAPTEVYEGQPEHWHSIRAQLGQLAIARTWLESPLLRLFSTPSTVPDSTRRLGFDGPSPDGSGSTGTALPGSAIGHLGFTGTSLWIDHEHQAIYILLSNRVHPSRHDQRIRAVRPSFHALAAAL
jgi:CubicO group peptidase (beta-lactamase class C family)